MEGNAEKASKGLGCQKAAEAGSRQGKGPGCAGTSLMVGEPSYQAQEDPVKLRGPLPRKSS